jgi:putative ABC transport system permease protein
MNRNRRPEEDFADEIRAHIQIEADRLIGEGLSPEDARALAERRFGNATRVQERYHESGRVLWLDHLRQDIRGAVRNVAKYPVACAIAVISLAGGIGATTATLMLRDAIFYRPPKLYARPSELSKVGMSYPARARAAVPGGIYALWSQDPELSPGLAAAILSRPRDVRVGDRTEPAPVSTVTAEFFSVLGVRAALGSTFDAIAPTTGARDDSTQPPAILSNAVWRRLFDRDPNVVGTQIWIDGAPHVVIGVMPRSFWFATMDGQIWTRMAPRDLTSTAALNVVSRRPAGFTPVALGERLQRAADQYASGLPSDQRQLRVRVTGVEGTPIGDNVGLMIQILLAAAVLLTLLIACTNVAVLMIAQWTSREHEIAIRASLGGARARIVTSLITESMVIAAVGGLLGIAVTFSIAGILTRNGSDGGMFNLSLDPWTFMKALLVTIGAGIFTGLAPALYETRRLQANPLNTMRTSDRVRQRWRHALVVFEIATTVALLVVTGALISATRRNMAAELGFDTHPLMTVDVENVKGVPVARVLDRLRSMESVASVSAATSIPMASFGGRQRVSMDASGTSAVNADRVEMTPEFFSTLGVALKAGRTFSERDAVTAEKIVILNDVAAAMVFPDGDSMGRFAWIDGTPHQVVGIVSSYARSGLGRPVESFFVPLTTAPVRLTFLVRTTVPPIGLLQTARRIVNEVGEGTAATHVVTQDQIITIGSQEILASVVPLTPLNMTALLLTTAGIYGVLAFSITRRSTELAVRIAIGATRRDVTRLVASHSLRLILWGILFGVGATFALTRVAQGRGGIFDSPGWEAFVIPVLLMLAVGAAATWIPLQRAFKINPASLLRST